MRDEALKAEIGRVHEDNYCVLGARKMHAMLNRPKVCERHGLGHVARCTVKRLMRAMGLHGIRHAVASMGSTGDSYDNALTEALNSLYKAELIRNHKYLDEHGPWEGIGDVEFATAEWVHWYNTTRPHSAIGMHAPIEQAYTHHHEKPPTPTAPPLTVPTSSTTLTPSAPVSGKLIASGKLIPPQANCSTKGRLLDNPIADSATPRLDHPVLPLTNTMATTMKAFPPRSNRRFTAQPAQ